MDDRLKRLQNQIISFRDERDWKQFHNPKDIALSISLEASELLELFQWKDASEVKQYTADHKKDIGEEMADIFNYLLILAHDLDIDLCDVTIKKLEKNGVKYDVKKSKGNHKKYTEL